MGTTIKVNLDSVSTILGKRGLDGKAQLVMSQEIHRLSQEYIPHDSGNLASLATVTENSITYNSPYARRMWYGKVMAGNPLVATDKEIKFQGAPMRGKEWTNRMMADRSKDVVKAVADFIGGKAE